MIRREPGSIVALLAGMPTLVWAALVPPPARGDDASRPAVESTAPGESAVLRMMRHPMGDRLPDTPLVDDTGRDVRLLTGLVRDSAVVISFYYTNCRGTCPGTNIVLAEVRDLLAADFGKSVRFISISVEPEKDDVPAIAEYAARYRQPAVDPDTPDWWFLTGTPDAVRDLRRKLEYYDIDPGIDRDPTQHAAAVIVGNHATGRWATIPVGIGAKRLAERIRSIAGWTAAQRFSSREPARAAPDLQAVAGAEAPPLEGDAAE